MDLFFENAIDLINRDHFEIVDPGPLHGPVMALSLRRDDKLKLQLETEGDPAGRSRRAHLPAGSFITEKNDVRLELPGFASAILKGVIVFNTSETWDRRGRFLKETSTIHSVEVQMKHCGRAAYVIDWLENVPGKDFHWPNSLKSRKKTSITREFGDDSSAITMRQYAESSNFSNCAVKLNFDGIDFYLCGMNPKQSGAGERPGCLLFDGTPDEDYRNRVRNVLSFALGTYLVPLGSTIYDTDWQTVSANSTSPYTLRRQAFDMHPVPPAPLADRYRDAIASDRLQRFVSSMLTVYDELNFGNLSWAYWHARAAPIHTSPAQFGAVIEELQRRCISAWSPEIQTNVLRADEWRTIRRQMAACIDDASISEASKRLLKAQLLPINNLPQRAKIQSLLSKMSVNLSNEENLAWRRRNSAAHGVPIPEEEHINAIKDSTLLRGLFHRMVLRAANAADMYIDYASLNYPYRGISISPDVREAWRP